MTDVAPPKRCLICANPDLNLVDGSSVWSQTIALALAATDRLAIDFLARANPARKTLFGPLMADPRITIIDGPAVLRRADPEFFERPLSAATEEPA